MSRDVIVYLDRDNKATIGLKVNGKTVEGGIVLKVKIDIPDNAFVGGVSQEVSTDTQYMSLVNNDTAVVLDFSGLPLKVGKHPARVTAYDASSTKGFPWDYVVLDVQNWDI